MKTAVNDGYRAADSRKPLVISIFLNLFITFFEFAGGLVSGSIALISDALHNLTDTVALLTSYIALRLSGKENSEKSTFGYKRAEVLAALFNASALVIAAFFLFRESVARLIHPVDVNAPMMAAVAGVCLAANMFSALLLKKGSRRNINIRSAYVHLVTDALTSLAVILAGVLIYFLGIRRIDSLITILIGLYVLKQGFAIVMQATHILMMHVPRGLDLELIGRDVSKIAGVKNVHHAHLWCVTENDVHFEAHIEVGNDMRVSETCRIKTAIEEHLREKFAINHTTLQFESNACSDFSLVRQITGK